MLCKTTVTTIRSCLDNHNYPPPRSAIATFLNAKARATVRTTLSLATVTGPIIRAGAGGKAVPVDLPKKGPDAGAKGCIGAGALESWLSQACRM
jgi:hypothetical protein